MFHVDFNTKNTAFTAKSKEEATHAQSGAANSSVDRLWRLDVSCT